MEEMSDLKVSAAIEESLKKACPWMKFLAVMGLISVVLLLLAAIGCAMRPAMMKWMSVAYLILAAVYYVPVSKAFSFASKIREALNWRRQGDLEEGIEALSYIVRYTGKLVVVMLGLYLLAIVAVIGMGAEAIQKLTESESGVTENNVEEVVDDAYREELQRKIDEALKADAEEPAAEPKFVKAPANLNLNGVKHVTPGQYKGHKEIVSAKASDKVDLVNDEAFRECTNLKVVDFDCATVGVDAFNGCTSLESVHLGKSVWWLRKGAFANCPHLKSVLLGMTLEKMEEDVFAGSENIQEITVPYNKRKFFFNHIPDCSKLRTIYLLTFGYYDFPKANISEIFPNKECVVYVPDAYLGQFGKDPVWSKFGKLLPMSKSKYFKADGSWK